MDKDTSKLLDDIGILLRGQGWTISTAESCTGGLISSLFTSIPGSSDYFLGGIIAYSNEIKRSLLSVSPQTLERFGAVSSETVKEMAAGVKKLFKSDVGISISGIAGPGGGTSEKPVGTVAMGVDIPRKIITNIEHLKGERNEIREQAGIEVLKKLRNLLEEIK
jgi:PncC family amidohydrolase